MAYGYFVQGCPTCGRKVQIRLDYLGKYVTCHHCGASFLAYGQNPPEVSDDDEREPPHPNVALRSMWRADHSVLWPFGPEDE